MHKITTTDTDSIRIPILTALATCPADVFGAVVERLGGLDRHLNDVVRGLPLASVDAAAALTAALETYGAERAAVDEGASADVADVGDAAAPQPVHAKPAAAKKAKTAKKSGRAR